MYIRRAHINVLVGYDVGESRQDREPVLEVQLLILEGDTVGVRLEREDLASRELFGTIAQRSHGQDATKRSASAGIQSVIA